MGYLTKVLILLLLLLSVTKTFYLNLYNLRPLTFSIFLFKKNVEVFI